MLISAASIAMIGSASLLAAPNPYVNTFCNPINVSYNFWKNSDSLVFREAADPGILENFFIPASSRKMSWTSRKSFDGRTGCRL